MNFGQAIEELKKGNKVTRATWQGYWFMGECMGCPAIIAKLRDNQGYAPASPYQADLLAEDWEVVWDVVEVEKLPDTMETLVKLSAQLQQSLYNMQIGSPEYILELEKFQKVNRRYHELRMAMVR